MVDIAEKSESVSTDMKSIISGNKAINYENNLANVLEYNKDIKAVLIATPPESHLDL